VTDERRAIVEHRLRRAVEALEDARVLARASRWNPCVSRLYYACFHAVSALLLLHGLSSSKHTGVRSLFNQNFVRTDRVPRALAQIYNDLFARRQEGDYVDFVRFEAVQVEPWMKDAEAFVGAISALVGQHGRAG
jgi:uncharacterized protein (UPF0332 family)